MKKKQNSESMQLAVGIMQEMQNAKSKEQRAKHKWQITLLVLVICLATADAQNLQLTPRVQPVQGSHTQVGNFGLSYTVGEPVQTTLKHGNLMLTQGFEQPEKPLPPAAPAPQTVCGDTAVTFVFEDMIAGSGADQLEWSYDSAFSYSHYAGCDSALKIRVYIGHRDTIWMRSRVSGSGVVSKEIDYTVLTVNFKPDAPTPPAPVRVESDTAYDFVFDSIYAGFGANQMEWALDSAFASGVIDTPYCTISLTVPPDSFQLIWLRSMDTVSGCVSDVRSTIAIVTQVFQRQPITVDSIVNVCVGTGTIIKIPNTDTTVRYDLLTDTGRVATAFGNNTVLSISTGNVYTNTFFTILSTDTATGDTLVLGYVLVSVLHAVDTNVYIEGDTLVYVNDSALYQGSAMYGVKAIYSIVSGSATVDSLTGWVYSMSGDSFTLRANVHGPAGCGNATGNLKVYITDVASPVAPAPKTMLVDTPIAVTVTFDSIIVGAGGDEIEWATNDSFANYHTINPYGSINISLLPGMDTIIWLRSNDKNTGNKSRAVTTRARAIYPLLSAGLLDKTNWAISLDENFDYTSYLEAFGDENNRRWAPFFCWESQGDICTNVCDNHDIWNLDTEHANPVYAYTNIGNNGNGDGSAGELSFPGGGILRFTASSIADFPTSCTPETTLVEKTYTYRTGNITSQSVFVDPTLPGLLEVRCKTPSGAGAWPAFWIFDGQIEYDIMENSLGENESKKMTSNIHDWRDASLDTWPQSDTNANHVACGRAFWKQTPCDYTEDYHTYSMVFSTEELILFVDGKETWSIDRDVQTPFPADECYGWSPREVRIMLGLGLTYFANEPSYVMDVDYIRFYQPRDGTNNVPESLQNRQGGIARTLESPNADGQNPNNTLLTISNNNGQGGLTHPVFPGKIAYTNEPGLQKIYYTGADNKLYNAYLDGGNWVEYALTHNGATVRDVAGEITVDEDRVYYRSTSGEIKFFQWISGQWANYATGVYCGHWSTQLSDYFGGALNVDDLGRLFYIGLDDNIYAWCPTGPTQGQVVQITNTEDANFGLAVHGCGCLLFYEDDDNNLIQKSWWNNWQPNQIAASTIAASSLVIDEENSRMYFKGLDEDVYSYDWDYNAPNANGLQKLGGNPECTDAINAHTVFGYNAPIVSVALSQQENMVYYAAEDGHIWYYFSDRETGLHGNWYKTPLNYNEYAFGMMAFEPTDFGKLFYVGYDARLHVVSWLDADNPVDCPTNPQWGNYASFKTDDRSDGSPIQNEIADDSKAKKERALGVSVYPNPSNNTFTFHIENLTLGNIIEIFLEDVNCKRVYETNRYVETNIIELMWNAGNVSNGMYFYRVSVNGIVAGKGKVVKN